MPIEDVFTITGRGTVVTGRVERGKLPINSEAQFSPAQASSIDLWNISMPVTVVFWGSRIPRISAGRGGGGGEGGQVVAVPGSITPHTDFEGQVYILKKEEGGRHNPFFSKGRVMTPVTSVVRK